MFSILLGDIHGNDELLYYPNDDSYVVYDTKLSLQVGSCGEFTFNVPASNPKYSALEQYKIITILKNDKEYWRGFIKELTTNFDKSIEVYCLEDLAYLNYEFISPEKNVYSRAAKMQSIIEAYNKLDGVVGTVKTFESGYVTTQGSTTLEITYDTNLLDVLRSLAGDNLYVRVRRDYIGTTLHRYIDFVKLEDFGITSTQYIQFGSNMLDFTEELTTSYMLNVIYPYGAEIEGEEIFEGCTKRIAGTALADQDSINKYGRIAKNILFSTSDATKLQEQAAAYLNRNKNPRLKLNLSAIDLAELGNDVRGFNLGDQILIIAEPFNIDQYVSVTEMDIDLQDLTKNTLKLSSSVSTRSTLTEQTIAIADDISANMPNVSSILSSARNNAMKLLAGGYEGGYVRYIFKESGEIEALEIADSPIVGNETKKWIWNSAGLGYSYYNSSTGKWITNVAMTKDGSIVADFITSGSMKADRIEGGTLKLGGNNNANGVLEIYNSAGTKIGKWDKDGISASNGSFTGSISGSTISGSTISGSNITGSTFYQSTTTGNISIHDGWIYGSSGRDAGSAMVLQGSDDGGHETLFGSRYMHYSSTRVFVQTTTEELIAKASSSDIRVKDNINIIDIEKSKQLINDTDACSFVYKNEPSRLRFGVIAQDVKKTLNNCDYDTDNMALVREFSNGMLGVTYDEFIPHLINYVKDLSNEVKMLKAEVSDLKDALRSNKAN